MRRLAVLLCLLLLLSACAAPQEPIPQTTEPIPEITPEPEPEPEKLPEPEPLPDPLESLRENLPVMDGSTSLIPLEAGIRAALFGISQEEATAQVNHSSTWQSFYHLLDGDADLIFSCPLSRQQWEIAAGSGVELETVPVAKEGFVFVVNARNPVETLTQEQLRGIYSGEITNWSQLGGQDLPIIPYQRNADSGSQNYMIEFMGDVPLMDAPVEQRPATMEGLMDVIAVNDNAAGAIGYSVYAYAADMYGSGDEIKFIAVDGVAPDKQTMAAGAYPLLGNNYAVFRADEPADSPVRQLVQWMTSYDGQLAAARAGYVTLEDIGFDYTEMTLQKYAGVGCGGPARPLTESYEYLASLDQDGGTLTRDHLPLEPVTEDGLKTYRLRYLRDEALQQEINACIDAYMAEAAARYEEFRQMLIRRNGASRWNLCEEGDWSYSLSREPGWPASAIVTVKNGWLSLAVAQNYTETVMDGEPHYDRTWTAVWDLLTGERVEPEALFYDDVEIAPLLNEYIRRISQEPTGTWGSYQEMKCDFAGLTESGWHLTADAVYIDGDNPYFAEGVRIALDDLAEETMVSRQPRDFSHCLKEEPLTLQKLGTQLPGTAEYTCRMRREFRPTDQRFRYRYTEDGLFAWAYLPEDSYPGAAAINETVHAYLQAHYTREKILGWFRERGYTEDQVDLWMLDWSAWDLGGKYLQYTGTRPSAWSENGSAEYPYGAFLLFDLQTGKQLAWHALLLEGWQTGCLLTDSYDGVTPVEAGRPVTELECLYLWRYDADSYEFRLRDPDNGKVYILYAPEMWIRW